MVQFEKIDENNLTKDFKTNLTDGTKYFVHLDQNLVLL